MKRLHRKIICMLCAITLCLTQFTPALASDNNALFSAKNMGSSGTVSGSISTEDYVDRADYYRYTVSPDSSVRLNLKITSNMRKTAVYVYDADGNRYNYKYFSNSNNTGDAVNRCEFLLNPGTYYIEIEPGSGQMNTYTMTYSTEKLYNTDTTYDDTIAAARPLPLTATVKGVISNFCNDEIDLYKLTVDRAGILKYNLKFYLSSINVTLYDEDGGKIKGWYFTDNDNLQMGTEKFEIPLEPGTYYLGLARKYDSGTYSFTQTYTDIGSAEKEPNDSIEEAQSLSLGKTVKGLIAIGEDTDFYKIQVPSRRNITFSMPSKIKNAVLYIYDKDGEEVKRCYSSWNNNTGKGTLKEIYKLAKGTYYLQVKSSYYNGTYSLTVSSTASPAKAKITALKRSSKIGNNYRRISLKLAKASYAEGYQIYIAGNSKFKNADKYTTKQRNCITGLYKTGKTYYVKVRAYRQNSNGEYIYGSFSTVKKIRL